MTTTERIWWAWALILANLTTLFLSILVCTALPRDVGTNHSAKLDRIDRNIYGLRMVDEALAANIASNSSKHLGRFEQALSLAELAESKLAEAQKYLNAED